MSNDKFNPTKGNLDYPLDEFEDYEQLDTGYKDSREDYERSTSKIPAQHNGVVLAKVPRVKDDASRDKMFDILEREERKQGV